MYYRLGTAQKWRQRLSPFIATSVALSPSSLSGIYHFLSIFLCISNQTQSTPDEIVGHSRTAGGPGSITTILVSKTASKANPVVPSFTSSELTSFPVVHLPSLLAILVAASLPNTFI